MVQHHKKAKKYYMLPEEEDPLRTIHNKNSIPKCMLLCAITEPRYDNEGKCYFDGKLGIWPFVRQVYFYSPMQMFLFALD